MSLVQLSDPPNHDSCDNDNKPAEMVKTVTRRAYGTLDNPQKLPPKGDFFCKDVSRPLDARNTR